MPVYPKWFTDKVAGALSSCGWDLTDLALETGSCLDLLARREDRVVYLGIRREGSDVWVLAGPALSWWQRSRLRRLELDGATDLLETTVERPVGVVGDSLREVAGRALVDALGGGDVGGGRWRVPQLHLDGWLQMTPAEPVENLGARLRRITWAGEAVNVHAGSRYIDWVWTDGDTASATLEGVAGRVDGELVGAGPAVMRVGGIVVRGSRSLSPAGGGCRCLAELRLTTGRPLGPQDRYDALEDAGDWEPTDVTGADELARVLQTLVDGRGSRRWPHDTTDLVEAAYSLVQPPT